ncbi:MAG: lysophospholipase L1-like esterase [Kiritimatiellia bacterium]|jgi:lysophospholipase L1-like esterase
MKVTRNLLAAMLLLTAGCASIKNNLAAPGLAESTMENETVFFSNDVDDRSARLLFKPERVLAVRPANSDALYVAGKDYEVDRDTGVIRLLPGSSIKSYNLLNDVSGTRRYKNRYRDGALFFHGEGAFVHDRQARVSYTYRGDALQAQPYFPKPQAEQLPNITKGLRDKTANRILLVGDSISVGYNASGFVDAFPHQSAFGELVVNRLKEQSGAALTLVNISRGGAGAGWGLNQLEKLTDVEPDLAIIAFGMNDGGHTNHVQNSDRYERSLRGIIEGLRAAQPQLDIILVANMLPNAAFRPHAGHFENRQRLYKLAETFDRVVVADVMAVTEALLQRKKFADISGNNLNHPNDFLHRVYADVILGVLDSGQ